VFREDAIRMCVSYTVEPYGYYKHDKLAKELAGNKAQNIDWGHNWRFHESMKFTTRILGFEFPTVEDREEARARFSQHTIFQCD
jgi:hypothetical protein